MRKRGLTVLSLACERARDGLWRRATALHCGLAVRARACVARLRSGVRDEEGQGTTEYAILVGVLVVIAIAAIVLFRSKIQELWSAIADGINGL